MKLLGCCDISNCTIVRRMHRNRQKSKAIKYCWQILDKIHCHYQHSYDINNNCDITMNDRHRKYNQLTILKATNNASENTKLYSFGQKFLYGPKDLDKDFLGFIRLPQQGIKVKAKYKSLKEE
eukprot:477446_1